ncbi:DUF4185 domain-containing protein [Nibricoccus sp. IMCC34717]|uniref:DUF4185 domain-containing protein n=1 Tax=Nibricoccus sp. IMCC34717 TaxID=3034021 RepID=UPI00384E9CAA
MRPPLPFSSFFPFLSLLCFFCFLSPLSPLSASPSRPLPHPAHPDLGSLRWTSEPSRYPGTGSDMHWWTWASDGSVIVVDEDGKNFGGPWCFGHVLRVTGTPPAHKVEEIAVLDKLGLKDGVNPESGYTETINTKGYSRYVGGVVAVGSVLYIGVYDYKWDIPGIPVEMKDIYSAHGGLVGFLRSTDGGLTWEKRFRDGQPYFLGPRFTALQFLTFGPGGTGTPRELEGWVYAVSNDSNWESGDNLFLSRVKPERFEERSAWEFFAGFDVKSKAPAWTSDESAARSIHSDPGHVGHSSLTYNPARKAYWLATFSDTVPHRLDISAQEAMSTWDVATELQFYEGPSPWGPWQLLHDERPWGGTHHAAYLPMLPAPWLDADGNGGTLLFTGDWAKHGNAWYGFMTQSFRFGASPRPSPLK